jgi:hypothetical protein
MTPISDFAQSADEFEKMVLEAFQRKVAADVQSRSVLRYSRLPEEKQMQIKS